MIDSRDQPNLAKVAAVFFRIGNTTFGGGDPTTAALQRELIDRKGWITEADYAVSYALARVTPGTNVLAFCAAMGAKILGFRGAVAAVLAVTLPSGILAVALTHGYETWRTHPNVIAAVGGTVAAVAGMMWSSVWLLVRPHITAGGVRTLRAILLFGAAFVAASKFGVAPVPIIAIAAVAGFLWSDQ